MSYRVPPARTPVSEVWEVIQDILVDVSQNQLLVSRAKDGHADQSDVRVLRFWLIGKRNPKEARIKFSVRKHGHVWRWSKPGAETSERWETRR